MRLVDSFSPFSDDIEEAEVLLVERRQKIDLLFERAQVWAKNFLQMNTLEGKAPLE